MGCGDCSAALSQNGRSVSQGTWTELVGCRLLPLLLQTPLHDDVPVRVDEIAATRPALPLVGAILSGQSGFEAGLPAGGRLESPHTGNGLAMVDVRIRLVEQPLDAPARGDDSSGEPGASAYAVAILVGGGARDVFAGVQQASVLVVLFQHHLQGLQLDVVHPGGVVPARVIQGDFRVDMGVLQCGGHQSAGAADDEVRQGPTCVRRGRVRVTPCGD